MYASELRTCALGAVAAILLGAGVGFGWHYFADSAVARLRRATLEAGCPRSFIGLPSRSARVRFPMFPGFPLSPAPTTGPMRPRQGVN
jgi:hypothetical protein